MVPALSTPTFSSTISSKARQMPCPKTRWAWISTRVSADLPAVEVIDQQYMAILNVKPESSKLTIQARMGHAPPNEQVNEGLMGSPEIIYYAVITPKTGAASIAPAGVQKVSWRLHQTSSALECSLELKKRFYREACRTNAAGTVIVMFPYDIGLTTAQADSVVQEVKARAKTYYAQEFESGYYNFSQLVKLNLRDSGCPLSLAGF
jgi:hypothetical protein